MVEACTLCSPDDIEAGVGGNGMGKAACESDTGAIGTGGKGRNPGGMGWD